jgi:hypothetical protein
VYSRRVKSKPFTFNINDQARAYPLSELKKQAGIIQDRLGGELIRIEVDSQGQVVDVTDTNQNSVPHIYAYWFAWQAFHRETEVNRKSH